MKRFIILTLMLFPFLASAGPPEGGKPIQVPFMLYCHPSENDMILAIAKSFGEHVAITADVGDPSRMKLFIFLNEEKKTLSIMGTATSPLNESCLVFSAINVEHFDRPAYLPKEGDEET
jgi:hypothetical protein